MFQDLKPYPEYVDAGLPWLDRIPSHWSKRRFKQVLSAVDTRSTTGEEELLTVSSARGVVPRSSQTVTMFKAASYIGHKLASPGDLVINSLWAWGRGLGVSRHFGIVSTAYGVYRPKAPDVLDPDFLHLYVRSEPYNWELRERSRGIWISRLQLTDDRFLTSPLVAPPLEEQWAIVTYLAHAHQRINKAIATKRRLIALLGEERTAIERLAVTGAFTSAQTRPVDDGWIQAVPSHWGMRKLKSVVTWSGGMTPSKGRADYWGTGMPWVSPKDMKHDVINSSIDSITDTALSETSIRPVLPGAVLMVTRGMILARRVPVALAGTELTINQDMKALVPSVAMDSSYLAAVLRGLNGKLLELVDVSGHGTRKLETEAWEQFVIPVPPLDEQKAILALVSRETGRLDRAINVASREADRLEEFKTRLTADVVTGQIDVRSIAASLPPIDFADVFAPSAPTGDAEDDDAAVEDSMGDE